MKSNFGGFTGTLLTLYKFRNMAANVFKIHKRKERVSCVRLSDSDHPNEMYW